MLYYILFVLLAILALLEFVDTPKKYKVGIYTFVIFIFIILGGLRWNTGNDWRPYFDYFTKYDGDNISFLLGLEPGFASLIRFLRLFSDSFTFYLIVLSLFVIGLKAIYFHKFTKSLFLALVLYWGTNLGDITAVRQMLAISLCCISTIYIAERRLLFFMIFVFLAMQIHVTSIIFFVAYPLYHITWTTKSKLFWLLICIIIGTVGGYEYLLRLVIDFVPSGFGLERLSQKALAYLELGNENTYGAKMSKTQRMVIGIAKRAVLLPLFICYEYYLRGRNQYYRGLLNLYAFGNIFYFAVVDYLTLQRMVAYFYIVEILLFCIIFEEVKSRFLWYLIIIMYALLKLISIVQNTSDLLVPYIWIFSENTFRIMY